MVESPVSEFDLVALLAARARLRPDVLLGIGDDAALLQPRDGMQLAVATDMLNADVHFPADAAPADIGWKALAVNLSDLAAMGATPAWCTLALALPCADVPWLTQFIDGFFELADAHDVALIGGDTTRGPLSVCVGVHGFVEARTALRRAGAMPGDAIWVSGSLGDAAAALYLRESPAADTPPRLLHALHARLARPTPRLSLGHALRGVASACIDVSDGLLADLGHLCAASGVGALVELAALPTSEALTAAFGSQHRWQLQTLGDDYELCFSAPAEATGQLCDIARQTGVTLSRIGWIVSGAGVRATDTLGQPWTPARTGYVHFDDD